MSYNENIGSASPIAGNVEAAEAALGKVVLGELSHSQLIAHAQVCATLALARLLYANTQFP